MVEYAALVAHSALTAFGLFARSAQLWLSHHEWQVATSAAMALVAFWIATWAFRSRS